MKKWMPASQRQAREIRFLAAFYESDSPTYQDGKASAIAAGYSEKIASRQGENLLAKYRGCDFQAIAKAMSIDRISIGFRLKSIIQKGAPRDVLSAARLLLANMGEVTDAASTKINISTSRNIERLVLVGVRQEQLDGLCAGYDRPRLPSDAGNQESSETTPEENVIDVQAEERYFGFTCAELGRLGCQPFEIEYFVKHQSECKRGETCDECSKIKRSLTARQHSENTRYAVV